MKLSYYVDFIEVKSSKSGSSAIFYYEDDDKKIINLIDAGYDSTSEDLGNHINKFYGEDVCFDNVIVTHNDNDHAGGIPYILENYKVKKIWMLRPWIYAQELIDTFKRYTNAENLEKKLREAYSNLDKIEKIAIEKDIPIDAPFQGSKIGSSIVCSPSKELFLRLVTESDKTPEAYVAESAGFFGGLYKKAINLIKALWGQENFPDDGTSSENEMSVVQYISLPHDTYLLTGDAGRQGLGLTLDYLQDLNGGTIPNISVFEVPHHGSRHNLSSELLDRLFGKCLTEAARPPKGKELFISIIQASSMDEEHPRKVVERAIHHRGGKVFTPITWLQSGHGVPPRENSYPAVGRDYPTEQEG